jgi:glycosyltransferase involved in cell wall biosynthesis
MKILFTTPVLEHPAAGGSQLRVENSIKALSQVCEMDIISRSPPSVAGGDVAANFYQQFCNEFHTIPGVGYLSANKYIRKIQRIILNLGNRQIKREARFLVEHAARRSMDVLWFGYGNISYPLMREVKQHNPALKLVCDTDSVWSRFVLRELPYAKGLRRVLVKCRGAKKIAEEKAWTELCDITTAVSEIDADYYRSIANDTSRIHVFSNVIDLKTYENPPPAHPGLKHPSIFLAGTYGHAHSPMDVATQWMLDEVLPLLFAQMPDVHFYIVGNRSDERFGHIKHPNITVTGKLPSVLPYLCHADVALVPLKFESGTRYKILESGACRVPLVSTTLGAEGIPVEDEKHLLLADTPQEFADAIVRVLRDKQLSARLRENCYQLVREGYSIETLTREAQHIVERLKA